jgi:hypothetical protein
VRGFLWDNRCWQACWASGQVRHCTRCVEAFQLYESSATTDDSILVVCLQLLTFVVDAHPNAHTPTWAKPHSLNSSLSMSVLSLAWPCERSSRPRSGTSPSMVPRSSDHLLSSSLLESPDLFYEPCLFRAVYLLSLFSVALGAFFCEEVFER